MAADGPEIETLSSRVVYENRWMRVREDAIRRRDGSTGIYGVVEKPDFAVIVPLDADGRLHLVEQYRYPVGARFPEFPQGSWGDGATVTPEAVARAELREETGLDAAELIHAGHLFEGYGYASQGCHVFLARGLRPGPPAPEAEEGDLVARAVPVAEVERMIRNGEIRDAVTVAAFGLLRLKGLL